MGFKKKGTFSSSSLTQKMLKEEELKPRCNNMACAKRKGTRWCSKCKTVAYCSAECQRVDWFFHQHICHPSLAFRLRALCRLLIEYVANPLNYPNLSSTEVSLFKKEINRNKIFRVSAFRRQVVEYYMLCCAICEEYLAWPTNNTNTVFFLGATWSYSRCMRCFKERRYLCPTTLGDRNKCKKSKQEIFIRVSLFASTNLLNNDVIGLIARLLDDMRECYTCSQ